MVVNKSLITKVCIDDFAIRKRYTYGTVMVDLETHRIVDILESREITKVTEWLKSYPNLTVISRDGANTYMTASTKAHPEALQVSDRFHLMKNLSEVFVRYINGQFSARLSIPITSENATPERQALYDTRNRAQRIIFAKKKKAEGYTVIEIAMQLHASKTTIEKYLKLLEEEIPLDTPTVREKQYRNSVEMKQKEIEEVRALNDKGHSIHEISCITGHIAATIYNYLDPKCSPENGHYDLRRLGKLTAYEKEVICMRSQGITYVKIHKHICDKGYTGTVSSLRVFMQKEREHQKAYTSNNEEQLECIQRKHVCKLIYKKLKNVKEINKEQYDALIKTYPILKQIYTILADFYKMFYAKESNTLDHWIIDASALDIPELDSFINGLKKDIVAVKNGIRLTFNNGLAEGSVNKIKVIKRIMYGRNSFELLRAKILFNEYYFNHTSTLKPN